MAYTDQIQFLRYVRMHTMEDVDNITKNIVREISRELKRIEITVDDGFCIYFVQLLTLDPKWGISSECQLNRENIWKLVSYCIKQLVQLDSPYHKNCISQHLWMSQSQQRHQFSLNYRKSLKEALQPLINDIVNFKYEKDDVKPVQLPPIQQHERSWRIRLQNMPVLHKQPSKVHSKTDKVGSKTELSPIVRQKLLKKILVYMILSSGLGHPKNPRIMRETSHALGSVFDSKAVLAFCELNAKEKETGLDNLTNLVSGIRLINEKMDKTRSGFLQFYNLLREAIDVSHYEVSKNLKTVIKRVNTLTKVIEMCFQLGESSSGMYILKRREIDFDPIYISYLITFRQQEIFLRQILHEIETTKHNTEKLIENDFENICTELIRILRCQVNIPGAVIFPLFIELAQIHWKIQDEAIILENYNRITFGLVSLMKEINYNSKFFKKLVKGFDANDKTRKPLGLKIQSTQMNDDKCRVYEYDDKSTVQLEYLGFCPWVIVQTEGGLIPGNPELGIVRYKGKAYIFSCVEGAIAFAIDPERYIMHILDIARVRTDLVHLLQIHHQLIKVKDMSVLYTKLPKDITTDDVAVQTEVHPITSNIDRNYRWNIWDMYKDAVRNANLVRCKTRSTQTLKTSWKHPVQVQTIEYRSKIMQTKTDNYTNVPTLSSFLFGLRGRTDDNQHIIDLTRPVEE